MTEGDAEQQASKPSGMERLRSSVRFLSALKYPHYRRFWLGNLASVSGFQMMWVAQGWLVYDITGSALYLGYAGLAAAAPAIILNLVGGVFADKVDQRRLIVWIQVLSAATVYVLTALIAFDLVRVWHVLAAAFLTGAFQSFSNPARQAIFPHLIDRKDLMNAVSLNSVVWQGTRIVAPAAGGLLIAFAGTGVTFFVCASSFLLLALAVMRLPVPPITRQRAGGLFADMGEGMAFIWRNNLFTFLIGMTFFNSFFGMASVQLLPVFARSVLDLGASGLGMLYSVSGVGALLGIFVVGSLGDFKHKGMLIIGGGALYGASLVLFAFSTWLALSMGAMFLTGIFNSIYMISVQSTLQMQVPDQLRGRVMGVFGMTWNLGPLGALQAGALASAFSPAVAVAVGGAAVIAFTLSVAASNANVRRLAPTPTLSRV